MNNIHAEALPIIRDLLKPNPWIYWGDFLLSTAIAWYSFYLAVSVPPFSIAQGLWFTILVFSLYRSLIFTHEISHFRPGTFRGLVGVWNFTVGIPMLVPSFTYEGVHLDHHRRNLYGTEHDGEYLPFVSQGRLSVVRYLLSNFYVPALLIVRYALLAPLGLFSRRVRNWTWTYGSSLSIDLEYRREAIHLAPTVQARVQEVMTSLFLLGFLGLTAFGVLPLRAFFTWYAASVSVLSINAIRTLVAHRYANDGVNSMSIQEQFLDSVDIRGNRFCTELWAPLGLRYHATHHLFPAIPYHNLGKARRILEAKLVENGDLYRRSVRPSLYSALRELWVSVG